MWLTGVKKHIWGKNKCFGESSVLKHLKGFGKIYANASKLAMLNRFMQVLNILEVI